MYVGHVSLESSTAPKNIFVHSSGRLRKNNNKNLNCTHYTIYKAKDSDVQDRKILKAHQHRKKIAFKWFFGDILHQHFFIIIIII